MLAVAGHTLTTWGAKTTLELLWTGSSPCHCPNYGGDTRTPTGQ